jgi:signal transduction histidine kinase
VRRIATDLRPAALNHHDLASAMEAEARRVAARSGLEIRVSPFACTALEPELATTAFRIFQEALTNAVRHAGATLVEARVTTGGGRLAMHVRDNGSGIPADRLRGAGSLGLLGMRERARRAGGALRITTRSSGTRVSLVVPLRDGGHA